MFLLYGSVDNLLVVKDHRRWMLLIFHYFGIQIFFIFFSCILCKSSIKFYWWVFSDHSICNLGNAFMFSSICVWHFWMEDYFLYFAVCKYKWSRPVATSFWEWVTNALKYVKIFTWDGLKAMMKWKCLFGI